MKLLFVDTAGWMACADAADLRHRQSAQARDRWLEQKGVLLTTDYVIDETLTLIRMRLGLQAAVAWWAQVETSTRLRFETIDPERAQKARELFFRYSDKNFSFTDCTSFVLMKEFRVKHVLTADMHFAQMGFELLPSSR